MKFILTSFRDAKNWKGTTCSIARWQPEWSTIPDFPVDIKPIYNGRAITEHINHDIYRQMYNTILKNKEEELIKFFSMIEDDEIIILCCWCNLERQQEFNGKLFCHRILLGWWIEDNFNWARVFYTDGAESPIWKR